jgi:hypothetical protein
MPFASLTRLAFVAALGGCGMSSTSLPPQVVRTSGMDIASLAQYRTYTYARADAAPEGVPVAVEPEVLEKARRDVDGALERKGYRRADVADLVVRVAAGRTTQESESALVIEIIEASSDSPLFHGSARDVIRDGAATDEQLALAVGKILETIPPSRGR